MSITTYAQLQAAAANWLVRGDLTARIPEFVSLAEARLNRVLRTRLSETEVVLTATPGARTIPLPTAYGEAFSVWIVEGPTRRSLPFTEAGLLAVSSAQGPPGAWTIDGATLAFNRPCDQAYEFQLRMLAKFSLSDAAPTNGLLADYPDAYLFATLCEAAPFLRDEQLSAAYEARLQRAIGEINSKDARARAARTLTTEVQLSGEAFDINRGA